MFNELKLALGTLKGALVAAACVVALVVVGVLWWRVHTGATAKADLQVARQVIKAERETLKITSQIDMRVNAEGIQTAQTAEAATNEIARIREARSITAPSQPAVPGRVDGAGADGDPVLSADDARVVQLARQARAAAVESGARLQSARTGAR